MAVDNGIVVVVVVVFRPLPLNSSRWRHEDALDCCGLRRGVACVRARACVRAPVRGTGVSPTICMTAAFTTTAAIALVSVTTGVIIVALAVRAATDIVAVEVVHATANL